MIIDVITINNVYMCERAHHGPLDSVKFDQPLAAQRQRDTFSFFWNVSFIKNFCSVFSWPVLKGYFIPSSLALSTFSFFLLIFPSGRNAGGMSVVSSSSLAYAFWFCCCYQPRIWLFLFFLLFFILFSALALPTFPLVRVGRVFQTPWNICFLAAGFDSSTTASSSTSTSTS